MAETRPATHTTPKGLPNLPGRPFPATIGSGTPQLPTTPAPTHAMLAEVQHPGLLDPRFAARFGATEKANRQTLLGQTVNEVRINRPSIVVPLAVPTAPIFYQAVSRPRWSAAAGPTAIGADAPNRSVGCGICLLHTAGVWWLYPDQAANLDVAVFPAEDGSVASLFLGQPGVNGSTSATTNWTGVNATETIPANLLRRCLVIQNQGGSGTFLRIGIGAAAAAAGVPPAGTGFALGQLQTLTLSGDSLWKGAVSVVASGAGNVIGTAWEFS